MRHGAALAMGLLLLGACGSRTDLWSLGGLSPADPTGKGGNAGKGGAGGASTAGGGGAGIGGNGGIGTGGTGAGVGGSGPGGIGGTTGSGGSTTGTGGTTTGTGGTTTGTAGSTTGTGGGTTGTGGTGGSGTGGTGGAGGVGGAPPTDGGLACLRSISSELTEFGVYFLVDKSQSMATVDPPNTLTDTRWARVEAALNRFARQTGHTFRTTVGFFPQLPAGPTGPVSCASTDYATPSAEMVASPSDWKVAPVMAAQTPGGEAPTGPAFDAASSYTRQWALSPPAPSWPGGAPMRTPPAIVLITDGAPTACGSTVEGVAAAAAAAYRATPRIRTYVLAVGSEARGLDAIAAAGGTARAIPSGLRDLDAAMEKISRSSVVCDIPLEPILGSPATARVKVQVRLSNAEPYFFLDRVASADECGAGGGWFYEHTEKASTLRLCPTSCAAIIDAPAGRMLAGIPCEEPPFSP